MLAKLTRVSLLRHTEGSGIHRTRPGIEAGTIGTRTRQTRRWRIDEAPGLLSAAPEDGIAGHAERQIGGVLALFPIAAMYGVVLWHGDNLATQSG